MFFVIPTRVIITTCCTFRSEKDSVNFDKRISKLPLDQFICHKVKLTFFVVQAVDSGNRE